MINLGWYDDTISNKAREQFRHRCLQTLALAMRKLSTLRFAQAGTLNYNSDGNVCSFQPLRIPDLERMNENILEWQLGNKELDDGDYFLEIGPFDSDDCEREYLMSLLDQQPPAAGKLGQGIYQLLRLFLEWMPQNNTGDSFVISHPDLDLQNVLVDESGTVTGLIDWDGASTVSRLAGCNYPKWLTQDWDPWNYAYRSGQLNIVGGRAVPSPRELKRYRQLYTDFLDQASAENGDKTLTLNYVDTVRKSLLLKSLELAIKNPHGTDNIVLKIFKLIAQVTGQEAFRLDGGLISQADDSYEHSSLESCRVLADVAPPEEEFSSANSSDSNQSAEDYVSRHSRGSTPPTEVSSRSSVESDNLHVESAMDTVTGSADGVKDQGINRVTSDLSMSDNSPPGEGFSKGSKGRHMRSGIRKIMKVLSPLKDSSDTKFIHSGATGKSIMVDGTMFEIVNPRPTVSNGHIESNSLACQIRQATVYGNAAQDLCPNITMGETNQTISPEEIPSSRAPSEPSSPQDLVSARTHSTIDGPAAAQVLETTGSRVELLNRPSKDTQEVLHEVNIHTKEDIPEKSTGLSSVTQPENAGSHNITSSTPNAIKPRPRRRLVKERNPPHKPSTTSASDSSPSNSKPRTKRFTSWLKSVVRKSGSRDHDSASTLEPHPSESEASGPTTKEAADSTDVFNEHEASSATSSSMKVPMESTKPVAPSATPLPQNPPGPQKFDLDNLEHIDDDRLWDEGFLPVQVCHDLVDGTLDAARMQRLKTGFEVLLNSL